MQMPPMMAITISAGRWGYQYSVTDDLFSLRRYLSRIITPTTIDPSANVPAGAPNWYVEPDEGEFLLPAVTIQLIDDAASSYSPSDANVSRRSYRDEHSIAIRAYGNPNAAIGGRADTIRIGDLVWRALNEGGPDYAAYRPAMWSFAMGALLARRMTLMRASLSMGLADTDDEGRWYRTVTCRVISPRVRPLGPTKPVLQQLYTSS